MPTKPHKPEPVIVEEHAPKLNLPEGVAIGHRHTTSDGHVYILTEDGWSPA